MLNWRRGAKDEKRNLFGELAEGFDALAAERTGKITLRRYAVEAQPVPEVTAIDLVGLRQR